MMLLDSKILSTPMGNPTSCTSLAYFQNTTIFLKVFMFVVSIIIIIIEALSIYMESAVQFYFFHSSLFILNPIYVLCNSTISHLLSLIKFNFPSLHWSVFPWFLAQTISNDIPRFSHLLGPPIDLLSANF